MLNDKELEQTLEEYRTCWLKYEAFVNRFLEIDEVCTVICDEIHNTRIYVDHSGKCLEVSLYEMYEAETAYTSIKRIGHRLDQHYTAMYAYVKQREGWE